MFSIVRLLGGPSSCRQNKLRFYCWFFNSHLCLWFSPLPELHWNWIEQHEGHILSCLKCLIWKSLVRADRWYCIVLSLCCACVPSWAVGLRALTTGCWRIWVCCGMGTDAPVVSCGGWKWGNLGGCEHQLCSSGLKEAEWAQIAGRMVCFGFCFSTGSLNLQDIVTSLQWEMSSREVPLQKTFLPTQLLPGNSQPQVGKGLHYTLLLCPNESRFSLAKGSVCAC